MRDERETGGRWRRHQHHEHRAPGAALAPWVDHLWAVTWDYHAVRAEGPAVGVGAPHRPRGRAATPARRGDPPRHPRARRAGRGGRRGAAPRTGPRPPRRARGPLDRRPREAAAAVGIARDEPALVRVEDLADRCGTHLRRLQRLFAEHVGVGPKWVLRRFRLAEVTDRMAAGRPIDWAGLAHELGYADQSHLIRDVTTLLGETPTAYAARYPPAEILCGGTRVGHPGSEHR